MTDDQSTTEDSNQTSTTDETGEGASTTTSAPRTRRRPVRSTAPSDNGGQSEGEAEPVRRPRRRPPEVAAVEEAAAEGNRRPAAPRTRKSAPPKAKAEAAGGTPDGSASDNEAPPADAERKPAPNKPAPNKPAPRKRAPRKATTKKAVARKPAEAEVEPEVSAEASSPAEGIEVIPAAEALDDARSVGTEQSRVADTGGAQAAEPDAEVEVEVSTDVVAEDPTSDEAVSPDAAEAEIHAEAVDATAAEGETTGGETGAGTTIKRRRRRRGGRRGRGRGGDGSAAATEEQEETAGQSAAKSDAAAGGKPRGGAPDAEKGPEGGNRRDEASREAASEDQEAARDGDSKEKRDSGAGTTRLQARSRNRGRSRGGRNRGKSSGRRPVGGVSEETRRAITEGPPRRMLVNMGEERTQVAVLEERTLAEHYVTRKEDVSYVGNIYLGRVQNVLPGMEAAFVDIGKGRNGVLYAGEVNYDEADLDGDLPRIEDHLKPGQTVLVQVTKDPMGTKGARLTQNLSIAGRYCVLAPGDGMLGISRKLTDEERDRLRKILKNIRPEGQGLIVRTAAEGATQEQLEADVARLTRIWDQVQKRAKEVKPLDAVYEEPHLVMRVIRDVFGSDFTSLVVDSEELAEQIKDYLADVSPEMVDMVAVHTGEEKIFDAYEVTNQVRRALEKKVWLKSGGYLIIEKTEAMWVIDVNTGKFVGKDNLEETVLKNNLESADEIARQLRLRDMGGIIVIDFVDMLVPANRDEVLKRFKRELARDKTKSRVMDISKLGLVQMTRKNVSQGLTETFTTTCETCEGRGATILDHAFH